MNSAAKVPEVPNTNQVVPLTRIAKRGHKTAGRKSDFDPSNPDHFHLDAIMPKEEASNIKYLNLGKIHQSWLKELVIKFFRVRASRQKRGQVKADLQAINLFSSVLKEVAPHRKSEDICRDDIYHFVAAIAKYAPATKSSYLGSIKNFLETCAIEKWGGIQNRIYIYGTDYSKRTAHQPKAIPEFVMAQIDKMILGMPPYLSRMMIILRDTGMRVSEALTLSPDCLVRDSTKVIGLRYMAWKVSKEHQIPISQAVVDAVTSQKNELILFSKKQNRTLPKYLFIAPHGGRYTADNFRKMFKKYSQEFDIRDSNGEPFDFHPHLLRHTLGTRMINNGVQQHFVQKMLGHETPEMTSIYAEINDKTLKAEFDKYQGKLINIYGDEIQEHSNSDSVDLQWAAKNINAQALPNGHCGIPVIMSDCPTANACLTCAHFRTEEKFLPVLEAQLGETVVLLENATAKGFLRQIETNAKLKNNLDRMIDSLKKRTGSKQ